MNLKEVVGIDRIFHSNMKAYIFFSKPHGTFPKLEHILGHKANFNRFKKKSNNTPNPIRSPWIQTGYQQQLKHHTAYKVMETEQFWMNNGWNEDGNENLFIIEWYIPMGHSEVVLGVKLLH